MDMSKKSYHGLKASRIATSYMLAIWKHFILDYIKIKLYNVLQLEVYERGRL